MANTFWCDGCCDNVIITARAPRRARAEHAFLCAWETFKYAARVEDLIAKLRISIEFDEPEAGGTDGADRPDGPGVG